MHYDHIFTGRNFMTPDVIRYGTIRDGVHYELSAGRGIDGQRIFGVTVRTSQGTRLDPDPSKLCFSLREAESYIKSL